MSNMFLVDYSEKTCALFGFSGGVKTLLKEKYGAKYNANLTEPASGQKQPGWIFKKELKEQIMNDLKLPCRGPPAVPSVPKAGGGVKEASNPAPKGPQAEAGVENPKEKKQKKEEAPKEKKEKKQKIEGASSSSSAAPSASLYLVDYSEKSIAIFGDTKVSTG